MKEGLGHSVHLKNIYCCVLALFGTMRRHMAPYGTIWCQNVIPSLAPYSAKTEPVLAPYGAKDGISFWHYMVLKTELRFGTIWYFLGYSYIGILWGRKNMRKKYNSAHFYDNFDCCIIMKFLSLLKVWSISVLLLSLLDHIWLEHTFTLVFMHHPCNSWVFRCVINQKINFSDLCL